MSMHLHHPSLSLNGKKKGKIKFRNAEEARKSRELDASWKELQKKWEVDAEEKKRKRAMKAEPLVYKLSAPEGRSTTHHIPSVTQVAMLPWPRLKCTLVPRSKVLLPCTNPTLCLCFQTKKQLKFPECVVVNTTQWS
jgi:hypothetical protein